MLWEETSLKAEETGCWQTLILIPWARFLFSDKSVGCNFGLKIFSAAGEFTIGTGLRTFVFWQLIFKFYWALIWLILRNKRLAASVLTVGVSKLGYKKFGPFSNYFWWLVFPLKSCGLLKLFSCLMYFPESGSLRSIPRLALSSQSLCFLKLPDLLP